MPESVCAVVRSPSPGAAGMLDGQDRRPDAVLTHAGDRRAAIEAGLARGTDWLWLLEGDAEPRAAALAQLLAPLDGLGELPAPVLLAGRVERPEGGLDPRSAPWLPLLDRVGTIAAARRRLVAVRLARWGSLLVHRTAIERHGPPRADFVGAGDLEWTGRILRDGAGYLAPRSVAVRTSEPGSVLSRAEVRDRLRMLRGDAWVAHESVWFAFTLGVDALRAARSRA